jgi:hypothetical protein
VEQEQCPANWRNETVNFGHLVLIPALDRCFEIPHAANNESIVVWKLQPGQKITRGRGKEQSTSEADASGMWRPGSNVEGKVCVAAH